MTIKVGKDEFCSNCMDWCEFDEEGKCKKCGKNIKKQVTSESRDSYNKYKTETPVLEDEGEDLE